MTESPLETETAHDTTTFEHFGRSWTVPVKRQHSHIKRTKEIVRTEGGLDADDVAAIYLPSAEYDDLVALDVDEDALSGFATAISEALGMGGSGNSKPSPASS